MLRYFAEYELSTLPIREKCARKIVVVCLPPNCKRVHYYAKSHSDQVPIRATAA